MKASKVFPAAMAMDVMGPEVRELAAKAPMYIPGQSRGPQIRSAAIATTGWRPDRTGARVQRCEQPQAAERYSHVDSGKDSIGNQYALVAHDAQWSSRPFC